MKVLIGQPIHEENILQLKNKLEENKVDIVLFPEGYITNRELLDSVCELARFSNTIIISGYKDENKKDRAIIIGKDGLKKLDRPKTPLNDKLYDPLVVNIDGINIGYLLCMEILKAVEGLKRVKGNIDIIFHPIGVGMFSDSQFNEWLDVARRIAKTYKTKIIGTSHGDGSYRNCGVSLPIAYYINEDGNDIFVSKQDLRTRIVNLYNNDVEII